TVDTDLVVRLAKHRVVYHVAERHPGRGRPRLHGEAFRLADEDTHGQPQLSTRLLHTAYGEVRTDAWTELHVAGTPDAPFSVVCVQVERLLNKKLPPRTGWLGHSRPGPPPLHRNIGPGGYSSSCTSQARKIVRTS